MTVPSVFTGSRGWSVMGLTKRKNVNRILVERRVCRY